MRVCVHACVYERCVCSCWRSQTDPGLPKALWLLESLLTYSIPLQARNQRSCGAPRHVAEASHPGPHSPPSLLISRTLINIWHGITPRPTSDSKVRRQSVQAHSRACPRGLVSSSFPCMIARQEREWGRGGGKSDSAGSTAAAGPQRMLIT